MLKVEGYIQRKTMLYKTGVEYGDYTLNSCRDVHMVAGILAMPS